jgi:3'-phosphoadenosine 5'-phosphosulfate sulfotransferase (PAPS reductase)/FAD synthetase
MTRHVVAISGGKDSTALALRLSEIEPQDYDYLITPTGNELPEMAEHWARLETLLGKPFLRLKPFTEGDGLEHLIEFFSALPNWRQRWCTRMLKIEPTVAWLKDHTPCVQYVGLRADEETREGIYGNFPGVEQRYPFREWGWGEEDVWRYLAEKGVKIPARSDCAFCYGQRIVEWYRLWLHHRDLYDRGNAWEKKTGHTFRSTGRDTWPASLEELAVEFERGRKPKGWERQSDLFVIEPELQSCRVCRL